MSNVAVLDVQWGDCGKGKVSHDLSSNFDWVIRANGSCNSGHQVYRNNKRYTHHQLPSVDYISSKAKSFLSSGMVLDLVKLHDEIKEMLADFPHIGKTIFIDPDTFIITQEHIERDKENVRIIGSTGCGVGPAVSDKWSRKGIRVFQLINDKAPIITALSNLGVQFVPALKLREEFQRSKLLFEGAQSVLLDLNCGPYYPYLSSTDCTVAGIYSAGFNFIRLDRVFGVVKPYLTAVGNMPLPTEMPEAEGAALRQRGGEIGATTGRPRRIGYLDLPAARYGVQKAGITDIIITKMDILNGQERVKVCVSYGKEVFGVMDFQSGIHPVYEELPGWKDAKKIEQIKPFVSYVQGHLGVPVAGISCGVNRGDFIQLKGG